MMAETRTIKIAVAQSLNGKVFACGPDDFDSKSYSNQMEAALCWLIESGEIACDR